MTLTGGEIATTVDSVLPLAHALVVVPDAQARAAAASSSVLHLAVDGYRQVADQASVALFVTDAAGLIVDANPATARLLGRDHGDVVGLTIGDITHPDDVPASRQRLEQALRDGLVSYRISKRYVRGDGIVVCADVTVSQLRDVDDRPLGFLVAAVDDTARLAAEEHARTSADLLRRTVDTFPDPWVYLVADRSASGVIEDFVYRDANLAACQHNRIPRERLVGRRLLDLFPEHEGQRMSRYAAVVDTGEPLLEDDVAFLTRGETRYFSNRAARVGAHGLSLTWRDTTEQVRLRDELASRAITDPLTGLLNRAGLDDASRRLRLPGRRQTRGAAVLYVDLDGLGEVNRLHGHGGGDKVLVAVADRLTGAVRADDVVARVGGDEFVVLAPGVDTDGAEHLALKLAHAVTRPVPLSEGVRVTPTVSVGVTVGDPHVDLPRLVDLADQSMLARKRALYADTDRYRQDPDLHKSHVVSGAGQHPLGTHANGAWAAGPTITA